MGEFVAITGESGSGKSTLLNVISGLDSYEEGEMYINGKETSHYNEKDFEDYRRKYISNIFQHFNLISSYTVYENIELILLLNGEKKKNIKSRILNLIDKVGLTEFKNTKASKLSGGQKQRVAIARALAKDTPIIIADEPTANIDVKSANEIIELLSNIAKDKLVIVVTHNYEQVEKYVTRKITIHDGKIIEDVNLKQVNEIKDVDAQYKDITPINKFLIGFKNAFNLLSKFLLLFSVYFFMIFAFIAAEATFRNEKINSEEFKYNLFFKDYSKNRIIINKKDKTSFTSDEFEKIKNIKNVERIVEDDLLIDMDIKISSGTIGFAGLNIGKYSEIKNVDKGTLPEKNDQMIIKGNRNDAFLSGNYVEVIGKKYKIGIYKANDTNLELTVTGVVYNEDNDDEDTTIYVSDEIYKQIKHLYYTKHNSAKVLLNGLFYTSNDEIKDFKIVVNNNVKEGTIYIPESFNYLCEKENCQDKNLQIEIENIYFTKDYNFKITKLYNKKNLQSLLKLEKFDDISGNIFINKNDYNKLYYYDSYQASVYAKDIDSINLVSKELEDMDYNTFKIIDNLYTNDGDAATNDIITFIGTIVLLFILFSISTFVVVLILKSRTTYYTTLRMIGCNEKVCKDILKIELNVIANTAFLAFIVLMLTDKVIIKSNIAMKLLANLNGLDYFILYLIVMGLSYLVSLKYASTVFKKSAMDAARIEV